MGTFDPRLGEAPWIRPERRPTSRGLLDSETRRQPQCPTTIRYPLSHTDPWNLPSKTPYTLPVLGRDRHDCRSSCEVPQLPCCSCVRRGGAFPIAAAVVTRPFWLCSLSLVCTPAGTGLVWYCYWYWLLSEAISLSRTSFLPVWSIALGSLVSPGYRPIPARRVSSWQSLLAFGSQMTRPEYSTGSTPRCSPTFCIQKGVSTPRHRFAVPARSPVTVMP